MSATRFWVAAILFDLVGMALLVAGALWEPILLLVGLPFALLGWLLLGLLFYGARFRQSEPQRYANWLWWVNLIAGISGVAMFALPALLVLPGLLLLGLRELYWLGAVFSVLGLLAGGATAALAAHAIRRKPKFERREPDDSRWETDAYRRWVGQGGEVEQSEGRNGT